MPGYLLAAAHWPDVEAGPRRLLVVPVGSLEQHGAHLPLDTDTRIAVAVAGRACSGRDGVGLGPAVAIGASGEHADFPGTLSIGQAALSTLLVELGRHASRHWPSLLLVNGHGGNVSAIDGALETLRAEGRDCHVWHAGVRPSMLAPTGEAAPAQATAGQAAAVQGRAPGSQATDGSVHAGATGSGSHAGIAGPPLVLDAHAGRVETSIMLALAPQDVRMTEATAGETRPLREIMAGLRAAGVREVSPNGVLGDPAGASAAEGEMLLGALVTDLAATIGRLVPPAVAPTPR
jgi:mycofactocin system creatininase family protein